eukprot:gb/GEZN01017934.1/.p1 GENE.gb/GEZN01017934.1/~~gb/GEZN01017934.1/.p1  ORF type:complete len:257 (-),score=31.79 gb/GEZN01017934.1/:8-691(-)
MGKKQDEKTGVVNEPDDGPDRFTPPSDPHFSPLGEEGDKQTGITIAATGHGNSEDGHGWVNPTPNELYRSFMRKRRPIAKEDTMMQSYIHNAVVEETWTNIMQYESLHLEQCPEPKLARFQGMAGILSPKSRVVKFLTGEVPFDRHDWFVDRCGKEVRYIIDYYQNLEEVRVDKEGEVHDSKDGEGEVMVFESYSVDVRPAGLGGILDRIRVGFRTWLEGGDSTKFY